MSLPWHIPLEGAACFKPKPEAPQPSLLKHLCKLKIHDNPCEEIQTGLMCDIGISNKDPSAIQRLIASGMTVAHLNMRDLEPTVCVQIVQSIRQAVYNYSAELEYVYPLALMVDIYSADIVTGDLKGGPQTTVEILETRMIRLTTDLSWRDCGTADCLYVGWDHLTELKEGDEIFIDSLSLGTIKLVITESLDDSVDCRIVTGGVVGAKMPVRITPIPRENEERERGDSNESIQCSDKYEANSFSMEQQVAWVIGSDIDAVLVPNTIRAIDVRQVKDILGVKGKHVLLFASIETIRGIDNIDEILKEADGIYLDRCIISNDLPIEKIFIAQKVLLAKCNDLGKPFICKAVINEQIPTLCVTDIANLVIDGTDVLALELNYESPIKKVSPSYDISHIAEHCLAAAGVICRQAERTIWRPRVYGKIDLMQNSLLEPTKALCVTAVELAARANAVVIICLTNSGRTAKLLSHGCPPCPIVAVTRLCHTARQLRFWRGVRSMHYFEVQRGNWITEIDSRIHSALDYCKAKRLVKAGDAYVAITGTRRGTGYCDSVRLLYASARDTVVVE